MIKDKTGKANGKLAYGWCLNGATINFNHVMITSSNFWVSAYTSNNFLFQRIKGNSANYISYAYGTLYCVENNAIVFTVNIPNYTSNQRITISRYNNKITVYAGFKTIGSVQLSTDIPSGVLPEVFAFVGDGYDIRFSSGSQISGITNNHTNETAWFPCQEGSDTTLYDVLSDDNIIASAGSWVNNRMDAFYNQFYGFTLDGAILVPNQFFGVREKSYVYDDGQTWYSFLGDIMDKRNYDGNTFGFPEIFNSLVHLSEFYPQCVVKNDYKMWNIKELYRMVFDEYMVSGANYSFFSKRYLDEDGYPIGLSEILFYSRKIYSYEENYLYAYLLNDDRSDDINKYPIPDINNKKNMSYAEQIMLSDGTHYLKYE